MRHVSHSNADFANLMADAKAYKAHDVIRNSGYSMSAEFRRNIDYRPSIGYLSNEGRKSLKTWTDNQGYGAMIMFIYSYWTVVGALNVDTGDYWITDEKFSLTTGRHMNHIRYGIDLFRRRNV